MGTVSRLALDGQFGEAAAIARVGELEAAKTSDALSRGAWRGMLVGLLAEMGQTAEAATLSADYLERSPALHLPLHLDDGATLSDPVPYFLAMQHERGAMNDATFERARTQWTLAHASVRGLYRYAVWVEGFAASAHSPDQAKSAIAVERDYGPRFALWAYLAPMAHVGHVHLLAGDFAGARAPLEMLAGACDVLDDPVLRTRALLWLGDARAASGDHTGACDAYARVLARWGHAKPKSVTADAARARMRAATCPPG
jgi:hypothetical protein